MSPDARKPDETPTAAAPEQPEDEIEVASRARSRPDRAGDPLDGLVNLFDLGIVLAVAFLLAALSSLQLSDLLTAKDVSVVRQQGDEQTVITKKNDKVKSVDITNQKVVGEGTRIGSVYRLSDGRTVVVQDDGTVAPESETPPDDSGALPPASGLTPPGTETTPPDNSGGFAPTPPDSGSSDSGIPDIFGGGE